MWVYAVLVQHMKAHTPGPSVPCQSPEQAFIYTVGLITGLTVLLAPAKKSKLWILSEQMMQNQMYLFFSYSTGGDFITQKYSLKGSREVWSVCIPAIIQDQSPSSCWALPPVVRTPENLWRSQSGREENS